MRSVMMMTGSHQYPWDQISQGPPERRRRGCFIIRIWSSLRKSGWGPESWSCRLPDLPWRIRGVQYLKVTSIRMIRPDAPDSSPQVHCLRALDLSSFFSTHILHVLSLIHQTLPSIDGVVSTFEIRQQSEGSVTFKCSLLVSG